MDDSLDFVEGLISGKEEDCRKSSSKHQRSLHRKNDATVAHIRNLDKIERSKKSRSRDRSITRRI